MNKIIGILGMMHEIKASGLPKDQTNIKRIVASRVSHWTVNGDLIDTLTKKEAQDLVKQGQCFVISSQDIAQIEDK